jgi:hypothetical protein
MTSIRDLAIHCFGLLNQWLKKVQSKCDDGQVEGTQAYNYAKDPSILGPQLVDSAQLNPVKVEGTQAYNYAKDPSISGPQRVDSAQLDPVKVENHVFRFRLWIDHNAAISTGRDSLDWRLRKSSVTHSVVLDILEDFSDAISGTCSHLAPAQIIIPAS